jgi:hypothetical protein
MKLGADAIFRAKALHDITTLFSKYLRTAYSCPKDIRAMSEPMLVCLYEDRPNQVAGLKILLLTLNRYCPNWPIRLRFPGIADSFRTWLKRFSQVSLYEEKLSSSGSYNVKPAVLLDGLSDGVAACLWLDTDVSVNGNLDFIAAFPPEAIVVTQDPWEYLDGSTHRCATWGLKAGRSLPGALNTAVVRVTRHHESLLRAWQSLLLTEQYLQEQAKPADQRNQHMLGDQDAISALLASQEFFPIPVRRLIHSTEILQHQGAGAYGPVQRWLNLLHGMPPLIHAMGAVKPWRMPDSPNLLHSPRDYYERTYLELSPYVHTARHFRAALDEEAGWLDIRTLYGMAGTILAFNRPALKGLIQAALHRAGLFR